MNTDSRDASDWLSPIIVKELRQGMRGRVFLGSFLLIQVAMMVCASGGLVAASLTSVDQFRFFSGLFWVIIGVPLLIIIPSIGNASLRSELQANSLELVYLTRLTPWRIVAGKWAALLAQSLLFVFSVLPYLVLRYFLGGIDLVHELAILATLLALCALLTAVAVGFSGHTTWLTRGGQGFFFVFAFMFGSNLLFSPMGLSSFSPFGAGIEKNPIVLTAVFLPLAILLAFEIGTGKIAPAAEVRSFHLRTLGLLFLLAAAGLDAIGTGSGLPWAFATPALLLIVVLSVCENPRWIRSIYAPYTQRGLVGRIVGRFVLYPGWPSGIAYATIIMAVFSAVSLQNAGGRDEVALWLLISYAAIVFPVAVARFIRPATANGFNWFLGIHLGMLLVAILLYVAEQAGVIAPAALAGFLPTSLALLIGWDVLSTHDTSLYTALISLTIVLSLAVLAFRCIPLLPRLRKMEQPLPKVEIARE